MTIENIKDWEQNREEPHNHELTLWSCWSEFAGCGMKQLFANMLATTTSWDDDMLDMVSLGSCSAASSGQQRLIGKNHNSRVTHQ